jgi:hypothetical protein
MEDHMKKEKTEKKDDSPEVPVSSKVTENTLKISMVPIAELTKFERIRLEIGSLPEARRKVILIFILCSPILKDGRASYSSVR